MNTKQKKFNAQSTPFLYSMIVAALTILAATGVDFKSAPEDLSGQITTLLSSGGFYAIIGVLITSIAFPIYNFFVASKGKFDIVAVFSKVSTWVSLWNAAFAAIAVTGFTLPAGTGEQVIQAVFQKDWMSLISILALTVGNTLIRFLKDRKPQQ